MNIKKRLVRFFYYRLGEDHGGNAAPPGSTQQLRFGEIDPDDGKPPYVATTDNNDGFELWLGTMHTWHVFYKAPEARRLAWFILWTWWIRGTWCGLKRRIWYWALHIEVEDMMGGSDERRGIDGQC